MSSKVLTVSSGKGTAGREGANESFATIIAGNGNAHASTITMRLQASAPGNWQALRRGFANFDPTAFALPTGYIISAAVLNVTPTSISTDTFVQSICLTNALLASPLVGTANADYEGTASYRTEYASRKTIASMVSGTAFNMTLNAAGVSYIDTQYGTGNPIQLGLRWSCDVDSSDPGGALATQDVTLTVNSLTLTYRVGPGHAVVDLTGTLANSADTVNCNLLVIEVFT